MKNRLGICRRDPIGGEAHTVLYLDATAVVIDLDDEMPTLDDYLARHPERRQAIGEAFREGRSG